ncbi:MAG: hypothetical protein H6673_12230 [Anaerolineales bacterium]|uniref:Uncharacterized protein n=1 Tax=Phototrophicus methaneseepsis TaxID=2710758 RepID=A0A7S8IFJ5_9CHLR|nr:hypothetical protein [Phototrophicus methaneseepsis]MCB9437734.1 hypothetical protein [Anaerolineales bacterium]QPC83023.1 hypothetical protein G4Y79_01210 [Phototrophicus methaneseepsis]
MDEMVDWKPHMIDMLQNYNDDQLWDVVNNYPVEDLRLKELTALGKQGKLSADELTELEQRIDAWDQQVLLRSEALLLLK